MSDAAYPDTDLLDRYFAGEASTAEQRALNAWLEARPGEARAVEMLRGQMAEPYGSLPAYDQEARVAAVVDYSVRAARRQRRQGGEIGRSNIVLHRFGSPAVFAALAGLLVVGISGLVSWITGRSVHTAGLQTIAQVYRTELGQQATVALFDGSHVTLGPGSSLSLTRAPASDGTGAGHRYIDITGKAYVTVAPNTRFPFVVQTAHTSVRVLGTTFMVQRYDDDSSTRVVVAEGRVAVQSRHAEQDAGPQAVLVAGTLATVGDSGQVMVTPNIAVNDYTGWTTGNLRFRNRSVTEVIAELARAYNIEVRYTDSTVTKRLVTWEIHTQRYPVSAAIDELATLLGADVQRSGRVFTFTPRRQISPPPALRSSPLFLESRYGR